MERIVHFSKEYHNQTTLHPLGAAIFAVMAGLMLTLPRRYVCLALFGLVCFVATAQRVVIAGADFDLLRLMILVGHLRVFWRGEFRHFRWHPIDVAVLAWWSVSAIAYTMLHADLLDLWTAEINSEVTPAIIYQCGLLFDHVMAYFLFRFVIRDWQDLESSVKSLMWISLPVAALFLVEKQTARNIFSIFGGVPETTLIREGRLRCQGAFAHPIIAGVFFATMLPLVVVRWWKPDGDRRLVFASTGAFLVIVYSCSSSTPVMALLFGGFAACMFPFRSHLSFFRWSTLFALVLLHFVREQPVWHLISRLGTIVGGTGWHRFHLIDQCIHRVDEWFLLGTKETAHWGSGLGDVTNEYVFQGVSGGMPGLIAFVVMIVLCYRCVGRLWRRHTGDRYRLLSSWALGCCLFAHTMSFISVSYFGQAKVIWFLLLASIASLTPTREAKPTPVGTRLQKLGHAIQ